MLRVSRLRTHCLEPEDHSCCDADSGHEGVSASVVAGVDAPPVLEAAKHVLDFVALSIETAVVRDLYLAVCL